MGLIAVCLPPVYGLFKQLLAKTFGLGSKCSTKPSKKVSSRFSDIALKRDGHVQLDAGSETDMIPLGRPVVTTDIYVEVTDGNTRAYAEAGESGRNDW
jgi:hypothetical protein